MMKLFSLLGLILIVQDAALANFSTSNTSSSIRVSHGECLVTSPDGSSSWQNKRISISVRKNSDNEKEVFIHGTGAPNVEILPEDLTLVSGAIRGSNSIDYQVESTFFSRFFNAEPEVKTIVQNSDVTIFNDLIRVETETIMDGRIISESASCWLNRSLDISSMLERIRITRLPLR